MSDGFGPFGRGSPPVRASIGNGHVVTGVVLSSLDCGPIRGARVELWQSDAKGSRMQKGATRGLSATSAHRPNGRSRFEGPYPSSYEGRLPHIRLRVVASGHQILSRYEPARGARRGSIRLVLVPQV